MIPNHKAKIQENPIKYIQNQSFLADYSFLDYLFDTIRIKMLKRE